MSELYSGDMDHEVFQIIKPTSKSDKFEISRCKKCGKMPTIVKNSEIEGRGRYKIKCCGVEILENTETACICAWNRVNLDVPIVEFTGKDGFVERF